MESTKDIMKNCISFCSPLCKTQADSFLMLQPEEEPEAIQNKNYLSDL
jgi:hypothetical protein